MNKVYKYKVLKPIQILNVLFLKGSIFYSTDIIDGGNRDKRKIFSSTQKYLGEIEFSTFDDFAGFFIKIEK